MLVKNIVDEDFVNYKEPNMFIIFPHCTFKCDKENGNQYCQNWPLVKQPDIEISYQAIVDRYKSNDITRSIVFAGLEPFEDFNDVFNLVKTFRENKVLDPIIIYSGFTEKEIEQQVRQLIPFGNIIIKYGRYRPNQQPHFDEVLGVRLANDEQYAVAY